MAVEAVLNDPGYRLVRAKSGRDALKEVLDQDFALILLDVVMPGVDGYETATLIRERPRSRQTPIIFLTANDWGAQHVFRGYTVGAVDYLVKPVPATLAIGNRGVSRTVQSAGSAANRQEELEQRIADRTRDGRRQRGVYRRRAKRSAKVETSGCSCAREQAAPRGERATGQDEFMATLHTRCGRSEAIMGWSTSGQSGRTGPVKRAAMVIARTRPRNPS